MLKHHLLNKLRAIEQVLSNLDDAGISLMEGFPGAILFFHEISKIKKDEGLTEIKNRYLSTLLNKVNASNNIPLTYCDGLTGVLTLLEVLGKEDKVSYYEEDEGMDDFLFEVMCENLTNRKFDFLHGGLGILWYFIIRLRHSTNLFKKSRIESFITEGVSILEQTATKSQQGYGWSTFVKGDTLIPNLDVFNMGYAHGLPGILAMLSIAQNYLTDQQHCSRIIQQTAQFILGLAKKDAQSQFPSYHSSEFNFPYNSRLAWCYGDLSISLSLYFASVALNDPKLYAFSKDVALASVKRKEIVDTSLFDAGLCHGTTGVAHMYGIWFQISQDQTFKYQQDYWMLKTVDISANQDGYAGFKTHVKGNEWGKDTGFLKGIAGIGLAITSFLNGSRTWNELLILG